jgi:hypothetical protein
MPPTVKTRARAARGTMMISVCEPQVAWPRMSEWILDEVSHVDFRV